MSEDMRRTSCCNLFERRLRRDRSCRHPSSGTRARAVLLFSNDALDLLQYAEAKRQPRINAGCGLPYQPCSKHELVADDLGVRGGFLEDREKGTGPTHGAGLYGPALRVATAPAC